MTTKENTNLYEEEGHDQKVVYKADHTQDGFREEVEGQKHVHKPEHETEYNAQSGRWGERYLPSIK